MSRLIIIVLIVIASCATQKPQLPLPAQVLWSDEGLKWNYFQEVVSIPGGHALARIWWRVNYKLADSLSTSNNKRGFIGTVTASMIPSKSFVKSSAPRTGLLEHEQIHFDIAEIGARKFRKELSEGEFNQQSYKWDIEQIFQKYFSEMKELNQKYDAEHRGKNWGHWYWRRDLDYQLTTLKKFVNTEIFVKIKL